MSSEAVDAAFDAARRASQLAAEEITLTEQIRDADARVRELTERYYRRQADVVELQTLTLASILARLNGTRDERLAREQAEAEVVQLQLEAQQSRHRTLLDERARLRREIAALGDVNLKLEQAMSSAMAHLRPDNPRYPQAEAVTTELADIRAQALATRRALDAGRAALTAIDAAAARLNEAGAVSAADIFAGMMASAMKVELLEEASRLAAVAQRNIDGFVRAAECAEPGSVNMPKIGTRWFADVFFDNIISDVIRHRRIERSHEQMQRARDWVQQRIDHLVPRATRLAGQQAALERHRAELFGQQGVSQ